MKFYTYIYGRTKYIDYRTLCAPSDYSMPTRFCKLISQTLNTDVVSNGNINSIRYLYAKEENKILFGIGFYNSMILEQEYHFDLSGRRNVRSFVGIIIDYEEFITMQAIPTSPNFFTELYKQYVLPLWELEDTPTNREYAKSLLNELDSEEHWLQLLDPHISECERDVPRVNFNSENGCCSFFTKQDEFHLLSMLKHCKTELVTGLNVESHVRTALTRFNVCFRNAVCDDTQVIHNVNYIVKDLEVDPKRKSEKVTSRKSSSRGASCAEVRLNRMNPKGADNEEFRNPPQRGKIEEDDDTVFDIIFRFPGRLYKNISSLWATKASEPTKKQRISTQKGLADSPKRTSVCPNNTSKPPKQTTVINTPAILENAQLVDISANDSHNEVKMHTMSLDWGDSNSIDETHAKVGGLTNKEETSIKDAPEKVDTSEIMDKLAKVEEFEITATTERGEPTEVKEISTKVEEMTVAEKKETETVLTKKSTVEATQTVETTLEENSETEGYENDESENINSWEF